MSKWITWTLACAALLAFAVALAAQRASQARRQQTTDAAAMNKMENAMAGETQKTPVLVELFTSEGCSSCPPADDVLARLEQDQPFPDIEIIALGQHVDYWNRLGWADPFSSAAFSGRQYNYAEAFGRDGVYTPQMIIDGRAEFPGSTGTKAREAIINAAKSPKATIKITRAAVSTDRKAAVVPLKISVENLPQVSAGDVAEVLLAITENNLSTSVPRGENAGRTLRHAGVVRQLSVIGNAQPGLTSNIRTESMLADGWKRKNLRAVVFVQERNSRRVLGADSLKLAEQ
ncbi:hypothetical protein BH18ACI2_BH18ACI2_10910 [soil metagenome]